jgi:glycosyltransferase involved in cell wall biosynthesis
MTVRRGVAANGDSEDTGTWSGIPHYLLHAGLKSNFLQCGLDLRLPNSNWKRRLWHAGHVLRGERPRGFQYSAVFLKELGKKAAEECERLDLQEVVSHYQLLPSKRLNEYSISTSFYIDTTLQDLFTTHAMDSWLNGKVVEEAIKAETEGYRSASRVVTMARWVQSSLFERYGVARDRVHTVLPGANLPDKVVEQFLIKQGRHLCPDRFTSERPFRIGFTGKDAKRKGLPRLVKAVAILNGMGIPTVVAVIGNLPKEYESDPRVRSAGFIDKFKDVNRFMETLMSCDLGCAPSHEEPMGIAPLEYLRLGIPVLCTAAGGLTDVCEAAGSASILLRKDASAEEIASQLEMLAKDVGLRQNMRDAAWERKEHFRWERTVRELEQIWAKPLTVQHCDEREG